MLRSNSDSSVTGDSPNVPETITIYHETYSARGNNTFRSTSTAPTPSHLQHDLAGGMNIHGMTRDAVDFIVHDAVSSGFLLKYCEAHFCSENVKFITDIDRFHDQFYRDKNSWPHNRMSWRQIDQEISLKTAAYSDLENFNLERDFVIPLKNRTLIDESLWPSPVISSLAVMESIIKIWDTFLNKDSKYWICIQANVLMNTIRRIKLIHIYGREVFNEALIEPLKTIEKDIYPRFLLSEEHKSMLNYNKINEPKPTADSLKLSKPPFIIIQRYTLKEIEKNLIKFTLLDLIDDQILYYEFLKYLEKIVSSENLLCLRAIRIFKDSFHHHSNYSNAPQSHDLQSHSSPSSSSSNTNLLPTTHHTGSSIHIHHTPTSAHINNNNMNNASDHHQSINRKLSFEHASIVYRYFIASGSPYEVSVSYRKKKEVMRRLADPPYNIFDHIESSCLSTLKAHYSNYILTKEYNELYRIILTKRHAVPPTPPIQSMTTTSLGSAMSSKSIPKFPSTKSTAQLSCNCFSLR